MNDDRYLRSIKDLEKVGSKWWPKEVRDEAMKVSILQYLLDTQETFISLLTIADRNKPEKLFDLIEASSFEYHLFLKHLILLTDVGSEPIQRFNASFNEIFPDGVLRFTVGGQEHSYKFTSLPIKGVPNNKKMQSDSLENLKKPCRHVELCQDLIMFLIFGAASTSPRTAAVLYKCNAYEYLGQKEKIQQYIQQNNIRQHIFVDPEKGCWTISKWLLRTIWDNLYAIDDKRIAVDIGNSIEYLDKRDYEQLHRDLVCLGYSVDEVYRGFYKENPNRIIS